MVECILARAGEKGLLAGDWDKWRILGCGVYFCWISGLMSMEKHMQSRLEPHPTQISPGPHSQEVLLPPIVALEGSVLYICKYEPWVSLNNYQLEILLMSSWATHPESNCDLTISSPPGYCCFQPVSEYSGDCRQRFWFPPFFPSPVWPEPGSWVFLTPFIIMCASFLCPHLLSVF